MIERPLPNWLSQALAEHSYGPRGQTLAVNQPRVGDLVVIDPVMSSHSEPRVALVVGIDSATGTADVLLTSEFIEARTDRDIVLAPKQTRLAYPLLIHLDVGGPVLLAQMRHRLGRIGMAVLDHLLMPGLAPSLASQPGLPLRGKGDPRWTILATEVATMEELTAAAVAYLDDPAAAVPVIDPGLLLGGTVDPLTAAPILDLVEGGVAQLPMEIADDLVACLLDSPTSPFAADLWKALRPYFAVNADKFVPSRPIAIHCTPPRATASAAQAFCNLVASSQMRGNTVVKLVTDSALWQDGLITAKARGFVVASGADTQSQIVPIELEDLIAAR